MTRHELKCWPDYFAAIRAGTKTFEMRRNDRGFQLGDIVVLREFDPATEDYTGQTEERQITYLLSEEGFGFIHGWVAIGFGRVPHATDTPFDETLTAEALAQWHDQQSRNAAQRAEGARQTAAGYARDAETQVALKASVVRFETMAEAGEADARFHAAAARLVRGGKAH